MIAPPPTDAQTERRLAAILAIDVASYSARSEADEAAAVRTVQALSARVEAAAARHGGRIFNTAGDGFMLEFPAVSGALQAAEEIAAAPDPPVRMGLHVGEVVVTPTGDLLGHGVNVAARLQALARPGAVLASDAVRRALVGPAADRLRPQGRFKLDKMSHVAEVFALDLGPRAAVRRRRPWLAPAAAACAAVALVGACGLAWLELRPHGLVVAVAPMEVQGDDPAARAFVQGLSDRIASSLTDHQTPTVSEEAAAAAGRGGARLVLRGVAHRAGDDLVLDVRLEDRREQQILWSASFEHPVAQADALGDQAVAKITDVVDFAVPTLRGQHFDPSPEILADIFKLADIGRSGLARVDERAAIDRRLIALAPTLAAAHADLAYNLALSSRGQPPAVAAPMIAEARRESAEALRLNPREAYAYVALFLLMPDTPTVESDALLNKALAAAPADESLNGALADFRRATGRLREAEPYYRKSLTLDPLSPIKNAMVIFALAGSGRAEESWAMARSAFDRFPDNSSIQRALAYTAILYQPPDVALKAIDEVRPAAHFLDDGADEIWRDFVRTTRRGRSDPKAIARLRAAALAGRVDPSTAASALALAGDADGAFQVWNAAIDQHAVIYPADLFENAARSLRADPRFWLLTRRLGLNAYWRQSGVWPDMCADPGLGYDCAKAAARAGF